MNTEAVWTFITTQGVDFGMKALGAVAAWFIGRWLIGILTRVIGAALKRSSRMDATLTHYLMAILGVVLNVLLLLAVLVLPLSIPVLIFGVTASNAAIVGPTPFGAPFTILCALSLVSFVVGPFAAAASLRHGLD